MTEKEYVNYREVVKNIVSSLGYTHAISSSDSSIHEALKSQPLFPFFKSILTEEVVVAEIYSQHETVDGMDYVKLGVKVLKEEEKEKIKEFVVIINKDYANNNLEARLI